MELIIASNNFEKISEIKEILSPYFDKILSLKEAGCTNFDVEETGNTFKENSLIKAEAAKEFFQGKYILADDSGICVDSLDNMPGIYSARYSGVHGDDEKNNTLLLKNLKDKEDRNAHYEAVMTFYSPKTNKFYFAVGKTFGRISKKRVGSNGFGYDPLFYSFDLKKSFGKATPEEKNSVSHRFLALKELLKILKDAKEI